IAVVIGVVAAVLFLLLNPIYLVVAAIVAIIAIILNWGKVMDWIKLVAREVWSDISEGVASLVSKAIDKFLEFGQNLAERLRTIRETFTQRLVDIRIAFQNAFMGIYNIIKGILNNIISLINSMISKIVSGINSIIDRANSVTSL